MAYVKHFIIKHQGPLLSYLVLAYMIIGLCIVAASKGH